MIGRDPLRRDLLSGCVLPCSVLGAYGNKSEVPSKDVEKAAAILLDVIIGSDVNRDVQVQAMNTALFEFQSRVFWRIFRPGRRLRADPVPLRQLPGRDRALGTPLRCRPGSGGGGPGPGHRLPLPGGLSRLRRARAPRGRGQTHQPKGRGGDGPAPAGGGPRWALRSGCDGCGGCRRPPPMVEPAGPSLGERLARLQAARRPSQTAQEQTGAADPQALAEALGGELAAPGLVRVERRIPLTQPQGRIALGDGLAAMAGLVRDQAAVHLFRSESTYCSQTGIFQDLQEPAAIEGERLRWPPRLSPPDSKVSPRSMT